MARLIRHASFSSFAAFTSSSGSPDLACSTRATAAAYCSAAPSISPALNRSVPVARADVAEGSRSDNGWSGSFLGCSALCSRAADSSGEALSA